MNPRGDLVPAVIQDVDSMRVLMVGFMDDEARDLTEGTGEVHFWSRSRQRIWRKGETSGNVLTVVEIRSDCDDDTLLVLARPSGPTCHTGTDTCFDDGPLEPGFRQLDRLWATIERRAVDRPGGSYTTALLEAGPDLPARKLTEEAVEVLMAAKDHATGSATDGRVAEEMADVLYHLLVVCAERGIDPSAVMQVLADRER